MSGVEVVIPTRGDVEGVVSGLIPLAHSSDFALRIVTDRLPESPRARMAIETVRRLGCPVTISLQRRPGHPAAKVQAALESHAEVLVFLDDDVTLVGAAVLTTLQVAALDFAWAVPIIRFTAGCASPPVDHEEIWDHVPPDDPRVVRAMERHGKGWCRVFDTGELIRRTDHLGGTCYAIRRQTILDLAHVLNGWAPGIGGADTYIGKCAGTGVVIGGVYAYHWGTWSDSKWGADEVARKLLDTEPSLYSKMAR